MATNPSALTENSGRITTADTNYPYGSAKNDSTGTSGDGTPITAPILNDKYGLEQALLRAAGLTPSGSADTAVLSQYLQAIVQQAMGRATTYNDTGAADAYIIENQSNQHGPGGVFNGMRFRFSPDNTNTGAATADLSDLKGETEGTTVVDIKLSGGSEDPAAGDIVAGDETELVYRTSPSVHLELLTPAERAIYPARYIQGLTPVSAAADTDHDVRILPGGARDADDTVDIVLPLAMTKRIDATWASGNDNGGLFSGTVTANTTYHMFLIVKDSDGTVDAGFDTSLTAANIPVGYTAYRRVFSLRTDSSANIRGFSAVQFGGGYRLSYNAPISEVDTATPGTTRVIAALDGAPGGLEVVANLAVSIRGEAFFADFVETSTTDAVPADGSSTLSTDTEGGRSQAQVHLATDSSRQIAYRATASTVTYLTVRNNGFIDTRAE